MQEHPFARLSGLPPDTEIPVPREAGLAPCPFCGHAIHMSFSVSHQAVRLFCPAPVEQCRMVMLMGIRTDPHTGFFPPWPVIAARWNRRVPTQSLPPSGTPDDCPVVLHAPISETYARTCPVCGAPPYIKLMPWESSIMLALICSDPACVIRPFTVGPQPLQAWNRRHPL